MAISLLYGAVSPSFVGGPERESRQGGLGARTLLKLVGVAASLAVLAYLVGAADFTDFIGVVGTVPASAIVFAVLTLALSTAGSAVRLRFVLADFGFPLNWLATARAAVFGTLGGLVFLQFVGQTLTRYAVLRGAGVSGSATLLVSLYERAVATAVLAALAGAGLLHLFGTLTLDLNAGGLELLRLAVSLMFAIGAGVTIGYGPQLRAAASRVAHRAVGLRVLRVMAITLVMQLAMLAAYVLLARGVSPNADLTKLAAAAAIVMFAASLPISFGGWGVRELSAVAAFGAVGVGTAGALAVSVTVGLLSQVIVAAGAGLVSLGSARDTTSGQLAGANGSRAAGWFDHFAILAMALPVAAATAVFFQVRLPVGGGELNVNLADPIALIGAVACLAGWAGTRAAAQRWRLPSVEPAFGIFAVIVCAGFVHGALTFGVTDWALFNRLAGTGMLAAYALTGALIVSQIGAQGLTVFLRTFVVVAAALAAAAYGFYAANYVTSAVGGLDARMQAMAGNPNAFGFQMLMAAVVFFGVSGLGPGIRPRVASVVGGLILATLWLSGSRASMGALVAVLAVAAMFTRLDWRRLAGAIAVGAALVGLLYLASSLANGQIGEEPRGFSEAVSAWRSAMEVSDVERLKSLWLGIEMWREHPIFGAGLGAFYEAHLQATGKPLIIHSTPVWFLAEFGIIGFAAAAAFAGWAGVRLIALKRADPGNVQIAIACLAAIGLAAEFMVHDMLYQRTFWLLLGACLALPHGEQHRVSQHEGGGSKTQEAYTGPSGQRHREL